MEERRVGWWVSLFFWEAEPAARWTNVRIKGLRMQIGAKSGCCWDC